MVYLFDEETYFVPACLFRETKMRNSTKNGNLSVQKMYNNISFSKIREREEKWSRGDTGGDTGGDTRRLIQNSELIGMKSACLCILRPSGASSRAFNRLVLRNHSFCTKSIGSQKYD